MNARDGFWQLVRAEWTKLRSVGRWTVAMGVAVALTIGFGVFVAASNRADYNTVNPRPFLVSFDGRPVSDEFTFVHQPMSGDGSIIARVLTQADSHEWAAAGIMIKTGVTAGSSYAALALTPKHGLRLQADFRTDLAVGSGGPPRWLKLTRSGAAVTGHESSDGVSWRPVGTVRVPGLTRIAEAGLFVSSPGLLVVTRDAAGSSTGQRATTGTATFDNVRLDAASAPASAAASWRPERVGETGSIKKGQDRAPDGRIVDEANGLFTVTGWGEIGPDFPPDDPVEITLAGILVGMMALIPLGAVYATSEFRRGMIRTTLALSRGRGRVLAAKTVVLGLATFALGLVSTVTAFLITQPILRANGFAPPAFASVSLFDPPVLRAVVGSAALLALMTVFSLAVGMIMRRSAGAITTVIALVILPVFASTTLPITAAKWLMYLTPTGGLAIQRAQPPTEELAEVWSAINPWAGLGAVCAYAVAALIGAFVLLRRRDA